MINPQMQVLISRDEIQERVRSLGAQITKDYPKGELYLIGILKGSFIFVADLARAIQRPVKIEFMGASSYGSGTISSGEVSLTHELRAPIEGAHVIIVEDIVDTGITLSSLVAEVSRKKPKSIKIAALLDKPSRRTRPVQVAYTGFEIEDKFVVGYGLDAGENYRALQDVCVVLDTPPAV